MFSLKRLLTLVFLTSMPQFCMADLPTIQVYKSQSCGCCKHWVTHLEENGFKVISHDTDNMSRIKSRLGISNSLASCHTGIIDGYFIEGHVPAGDIKRLITQKPDIKGLSVPGMPAGQNVPGMETRPGNAVFDVLSVGNDAIRVYSNYR